MCDGMWGVARENSRPSNQLQSAAIHRPCSGFFAAVVSSRLFHLLLHLSHLPTTTTFMLLDREQVEQEQVWGLRPHRRRQHR